MFESGDAERAGRFDVAALRVDDGLPAPGDTARFFSETRLVAMSIYFSGWLATNASKVSIECITNGKIWDRLA
jgi:hypothetical protein